MMNGVLLMVHVTYHDIHLIIKYVVKLRNIRKDKSEVFNENRCILFFGQISAGPKAQFLGFKKKITVFVLLTFHILSFSKMEKKLFLMAIIYHLMREHVSIINRFTHHTSSTMEHCAPHSYLVPNSFIVICVGVDAMVNEKLAVMMYFLYSTLG